MLEILSLVRLLLLCPLLTTVYTSHIVLSNFVSCNCI